MCQRLAFLFFSANILFSERNDKKKEILDIFLPKIPFFFPLKTERRLQHVIMISKIRQLFGKTFLDIKIHEFTVCN